MRSEWDGTIFPCVPGHEIVGQLTSVGADVTEFKAGDLVGVGCMVDGCGHCACCDEGLEQYCENGFTGTCNASEPQMDRHTQGGYSDKIVVKESFVLSITHPEADLAAVAPLLCAGITTCYRCGIGIRGRARRSATSGSAI